MICAQSVTSQQQNGALTAAVNIWDQHSIGYMGDDFYTAQSNPIYYLGSASISS